MGESSVLRRSNTMLSINQIVNSTSPLPQQSLAMLQLLSKQSGELNALELEHLTAKLRLDIAQFEKKAARGFFRFFLDFQKIPSETVVF